MGFQIFSIILQTCFLILDKFVVGFLLSSIYHVVWDPLFLFSLLAASLYRFSSTTFKVLWLPSFAGLCWLIVVFAHVIGLFIGLVLSGLLVIILYRSYFSSDVMSFVISWIIQKYFPVRNMVVKNAVKMNHVIQQY